MTDNLETTPTTFEREERFIVVKRKHLTEVQETALYAHMDRMGIGTVECVVVESDWPEYETVWQMIEARHTGKPFATAREVEGLRAEVARLKAERDTPQVADFTEAVRLEAAHQRERWGSEHDAGKSPYDWFWLIGYLAQKAADAAVRGDIFKAQHHTISTAAALANWHTALGGGDDAMRPGIMPSDEAQARAALEGKGG